VKNRFDIIIIGAGIVGLMIARFLSRYALKVLVIEKEDEICKGASGANSATIHTGHSVLTGTLKAEMNVKGNAMWDGIASELHIPLDRRGDYVVAIGEDETPALERLMGQAKSNGVVGISIISGDELRRREPRISPLASAALWSPNTGLCDSLIATIKVAENANANGVIIQLNTCFEDFIFDGEQIIGIKTNRGIISSRWIINAAGIYADEIMHKAGLHAEFRIVPRRGQYIVLDGNRFPFSILLSPVPNKISKGIAIKPTFDRGVLLGSNAEAVKQKEDVSITQTGLNEVWAGACKLIPSLSREHVTGVFSGLRASGNAVCKNNLVDYQADFLIECAEKPKGIINIAGIESPGLTASPAIALHVIELLKEVGEKLIEKPAWNPFWFENESRNKSTVEERARLLQKAKYQDAPNWFK
jgi:glycerol-3-phosphate dehydrogenase